MNALICLRDGHQDQRELLGGETYIRCRRCFRWTTPERQLARSAKAPADLLTKPKAEVKETAEVNQ